MFTKESLNNTHKQQHTLTHDVSGDLLVDLRVAFVEDHEEQVEPAHDGRRYGHVGLERLRAVVAAEHGVGCVVCSVWKMSSDWVRK